MEELAKELTALMNEIEQEYKETGIAIGYDADAPDDDQDPRMVRIGNLISIIEALAPDLLDPRLQYPD